MGILDSKEFNVFLYASERRHCIDGVIHTINKRGFATGEEQPYFTDEAMERIMKKVDKLKPEDFKGINIKERE